MINSLFSGEIWTNNECKLKVWTHLVPHPLTRGADVSMLESLSSFSTPYVLTHNTNKICTSHSSHPPIREADVWTSQSLYLRFIFLLSACRNPKLIWLCLPRPSLLKWYSTSVTSSHSRSIRLHIRIAISPRLLFIYLCPKATHLLTSSTSESTLNPNNVWTPYSRPLTFGEKNGSTKEPFYLSLLFIQSV